MSTEKFTTTLPYEDDPRFFNRATYIQLPTLGSQTFWDEMKVVGRILRAAWRKETLLLFSSFGRYHPDLLATAVIGLWPKRFRPLLIIMGEMWQPSNSKRKYIERLIVKLADRAVYRYAVATTDEMEIFPQVWQIDPEKTRCCLYFFTIDERDLAVEIPPLAHHIFSGGNSFRDYDTLVQVARKCPDTQFVIATKRLADWTDLPVNVTVQPMAHQEFMQSLRSAAVVIVPMQQGLSRAVGQQTYLNAMWLGKPTIVNQALGVLDHIQPGNTGLVVNGSIDSYIDALNWVLDPKNEEAVAQLCQEAHKVVDEQFSFQAHISRILQVVDEAIADWEKPA